jgi:uncharacterized protein (DUF2141 family)
MRLPSFMMRIPTVQLDTNQLGIPTEGYGFSDNAKALIGTP